jgi:hypothetical protein
MGKISFKMNARDFKKAIKEYPEDLVKELRKASKRSASIVEDEAKQNHRYTTRLGNLRDSVKGYGGVTASVLKEGIFKRLKELLKFGMGAKAYVELVLHDEGHPLGTEYGKYIHEGFKSWGADKFIDKSMAKHQMTIIRNWREAIDKANRKF